MGGLIHKNLSLKRLQGILKLSSAELVHMKRGLQFYRFLEWYCTWLSKPLQHVYFRQTIASSVFEERKSLCGECLKVLSCIEGGQESLKINDYDVILKQTRNIL
jgi:hypothetical protein